MATDTWACCNGYTARNQCRMRASLFSSLLVLSALVAGCRAATITTPCTANTFMEYPNRHSFNGAPQTSISNVSACQAFCSAQPACLGLDFNTANNQCYTYTSQALLAVWLNYTGINQYIIQRCAAAAQTGTVAGAVTTAASTTACTANIFTVRENYHSFGGSPSPGNDVPSCEAACSASPSCLGFDFNVGNSNCFSYNNSALFANGLNISGNNQYTIHRCVNAPTASAVTNGVTSQGQTSATATPVPPVTSATTAVTQTPSAPSATATITATQGSTAQPTSGNTAASLTSAPVSGISAASSSSAAAVTATATVAFSATATGLLSAATATVTAVSGSAATGTNAATGQGTGTTLMAVLTGSAASSVAGTVATGTGTAVTGTGTAVTGTGTAITGAGTAVTGTSAALTGTGTAVLGTGTTVTGTGTVLAGTATTTIAGSAGTGTTAPITSVTAAVQPATTVGLSSAVTAAAVTGTFPVCGPSTECLVCASPSLCTVCGTPSGVPPMGPLIGTPSSCAPCAGNCRDCTVSGSGKCDVCLAGHGPAPGQSCGPCATKCMTCQMAGQLKCNACNPGYTLNATAMAATDVWCYLTASTISGATALTTGNQTSMVSAVTAAVATGTIATGSVATGTTASAPVATGTIATGTMAMGTAATGTLATGTIATGTTATGIVATGTIAIGTVATLTVATGTVASAPIVTGTMVTGTVAGTTMVTGSIATGTMITTKNSTTPCPSWLETLNYHSSGATQQPGVSNVTACQSLCLAMPACVALDFNTVSSTCWTYNNASLLSLSETQAGINQYQLTRCPSTTQATASTISGATALTTGSQTSIVSAVTAAVATGTIATGSVATGTTASVPVATGTISTGTMATGTAATGTLATGTIATGTMATGTAATGTVATGTMATGTVATGTVATGSIATGTTASAPVATGTIASGTMATGTIATGTVATGTVASAPVVTGTVATGTIATGTVATGTIATGTVATGTIATGTMTMATNNTTPCPTWLEIPNWHSSGATLQPGVSNVTACQSLCLAMPACIALDFNTLTSTCWTYNSTSPQSGPQTGINQYKLTRCPSTAQGSTAAGSTGSTGSAGSTGSSVTTTLSANASPASSATPGLIVCTSPTYTAKPGMHSINGTPQANINSVTQCQTFCIALAGCVALDFNFLNNDCFTYTDPNLITYTLPAQNITQYVLQRCATTVATSSAASTLSSSSSNSPPPSSISPASSGSSVSSASSLSPGSSTSSASPVPSTSSMASASSLASTTAATASTTTGAGPPCNPKGPSWTAYFNMSAKGGVKYAAYNTIASCGLFCLQTPSCVAISFTAQTTFCYVFTNSANLADMFADIGTNLFVVNTNQACSSGSGAPVADSDVINLQPIGLSPGGDPLPSTTTTAVGDASANSSGCVPEFPELLNTHSQNGLQLSGIPNLQACQDFCVSMPPCVGLDWNTMDNSCWVYYDESYFDERAPAEGINQYLVLRC